jgi:hypothetical protein
VREKAGIDDWQARRGSFDICSWVGVVERILRVSSWRFLGFAFFWVGILLFVAFERWFNFVISTLSVVFLLVWNMTE